MIKRQRRRVELQEIMKNHLKEVENDNPSRIDLHRFNKEKDTYLENWDLELMEHTIRSVFIKLNKEEVKVLIKVCIGEIEFSENNIPEELKYVYQLIDKQINNFKDGIFVRIGSRRYSSNNKDNKCLNALDVFNTIIDNISIFEDLCMMDRLEYEPFIVLREWLPFEKHLEFRTFIKDGEIKGISQYFYNECFLDLQDMDYLEDVVDRINNKFEDIKKHVTLDDVVIDFIIFNNDVYILELNSFSKVWTDPCLFNWSTDLFEEFEIRVVDVEDE